MTDLILFVILAAIITAASLYIYKAKKRGVKCIGCPSACNCSNQHSCCGCQNDPE